VAITLYERTFRGRLTDEHHFGEDPLAEDEGMFEERNRLFFQHFTVKEIFSQCVNGRNQMFKNAILFHIDTTLQLSGR